MDGRMNKDDVIRMAREAGVLLAVYRDSIEHLERFAALAFAAGAAHEREVMFSDGWRQCAKGQRTTQFCAAAEKVRLEEREECARACDNFYGSWIGIPGRYEFMGEGAEECAAAIRARGETK